MTEGLFRPDEFDAPSELPLRRVLGSVVKVRPHRTLEYDLFETQPEAEAWSGTIVHDDGSETFRLGMTDRDVARCEDPEYANRLFRHEFCELVEQGASLPASTRIRGHGNGISLAGSDRIVTCYHLASGPVEAAGRADSFHDDPVALADAYEVEVPVDVSANGEVEYTLAEHVELVEDPSADAAFGDPGLDAVTLQVRPSPCSGLEMRTDPVSDDEPLVLAGYGMRTARPAERRETIGYDDADYDLRLSRGHAVGEQSETVRLTDLDAAPGHSGSPVVDRRGQLVGMYVGSTGNGLVDCEGVERRHLKVGALMNHFEGVAGTGAL